MKPDALRTTDGQEYLSVEALRGVAALMVVFVHYRGTAGVSLGWLDFGFTGVDLFFVLSGFVFGPYLFGKTLAVRPFMVRRFFRLYPLYLLALGTYAALRALQGQPVDHLVRHLLLLHTWESFDIAFHFNPAFWSLPPEVEFYLLLPLVARLCRSPRSFALLSVVALGLHLGIAFLSPAVPGQTNWAYTLGVHLPGLWIEFALGGWAWCWARLAPPSSTSARLGIALAGALGWLALAAVFHHLRDPGVFASDVWRGNLGLLAAASFVPIVVALASGPPTCNAALNLAARTAGQLSYGTYLFHNAALSVALIAIPAASGAARAVLALGLTLVTAALLHVTVEAPCRRLGRRWARGLAAA